MAKVLGQSGAWSAVASGIAQYGYEVHRPAEIEPLAVRLRESRPGSIAAKRVATMALVQDKATQIADLTAAPGLFRRFFSGFKVRSLRSQISALYADDARYAESLDAAIRHLESLPRSQELAGAQAELGVIEQLSGLPAGCTVFNDVRLRAKRYIHFNGTALQSAQLDHVVLSPGGVFVIETKCWSRRFAESGDYFDPFEQVARGAYLCYDLLRARFGRMPVRSVVACVGSVLQAPVSTPPEYCAHSAARKLVTV